MKDPLIILLVLFVLVGLAYSPFKKANLNKSNNSNTPSSIETASDNLGSSSNKNVAENIKQTEAEVKKLEENVNKEAEKSVRSPYYNKIRMSGISGLYQSDPNREYFTISTGLSKNETVKITGWYLKSDVTGNYVVIGGASMLPVPFNKAESNVVLQQGDRAYLTKGFSPIGISFRTNKCTGFFEEDRDFVPSLSTNCPRPIDEKLPSFSSDLDRNDECINIIEGISQCRTKDSAFIRDLPDTVPSTCKTYITTQINYNSCVAKHFSDTDFPSNEYRLYFNKFGPLWRTTHDTINLRDENGLVVDTVSY
jgi:hypothetical protein